MEPAVLVMDEPTSGLDPRGRRELIALLAGLNRTLVIATHDLPLLSELCPRVLVLADLYYLLVR
jgi:energy-coupling factor transporter ATP-binding protein EcfA2